VTYVLTALIVTMHNNKNWEEPMWYVIGGLVIVAAWCAWRLVLWALFSDDPVMTGDPNYRNPATKD
jgi:hypothetical protein